MSGSKDILTVCREWQDYWAAQNEEKLTRFAKSAGDEIEHLRRMILSALDCLGHDDPKGAYRALTSTEK